MGWRYIYFLSFAEIFWPSFYIYSFIFFFSFIFIYILWYSGSMNHRLLPPPHQCLTHEESVGHQNQWPADIWECQVFLASLVLPGGHVFSPVWGWLAWACVQDSPKSTEWILFLYYYFLMVMGQARTHLKVKQFLVIFIKTELEPQKDTKSKVSRVYFMSSLG